MAQQSDSKAPEPDIKPSTEPVATPSAADAADGDLSVEMAASYGTRSRNRTGSSRPNYAEDRDYDVEMYDYDHDKAHGDAKKPSRQVVNATSNGESARGSASSRKSTGNDAKPVPSQNGSKEQTPAGGTATPNSAQTSSSATQPSRKRKAATAAQQASSGAASTSNKRAGTAAQNSTPPSWPETNMLTFSNSRSRPQNGRLVADDGTVLEANDHVYLVCEPPGEPYYLGRIMEFLHPQNDKSKPVDAVRINWFYRPRDIGRKVHDTRVVFATMHSDISPLTALRGKCQIRHRVEIANMDEYRRTPDSFWFEKLYDRYIQKNYDLVPTSSIVNVPEKVKKVLDERWKFVIVEQGRGKELTSAVKLCKRCSGYCASNDSVDCAVCQNTYHMNCVRPPLLKKPSRGFAWSCAACSRAQERKLEARHTPNLNDPQGDADEDEPFDEDDEAQCGDTGRSSPEEGDETHHYGTAEQIYNASLWPWRYLGMHCKPEDALDYDDRIYPRASTRIGPRHQATVHPWPGRPVQYVKPPEKKKGKKDAKAIEEAQAAELLYPGGKRPKWVQDTPPGWRVRGEDTIDPDDPNATSKLLWKPPASEDTARKAQSYMKEASGLGKSLGLPERSTNLWDVALQTLFQKDYDTEKAMKALVVTDKAVFKEPAPTPAELKRFEEGVAKYGSELHLVMKHVKTMTPGQVTRFYYTWKKTERGQAVWTNYPGRKGKKEAKRAEAAATKMADDVADHDDDSAFDSGKAVEKKRAFMCQFCSGTTSRRWRRAPNAAPGLVNENGAKASSKDKGGQYIIALCTRCAELWRRYAIRWEDLDEISKKVSQGGSKAWKRKQDEEVLKELQAANDRGLLTPDRPATPLNGATPGSGQEPPKKKIKAIDKDTDSDYRSGSGVGATKKKDKVPEAPVMPEMPKPRTLPCAVCDQVEPMADHTSCRECRLSVHRSCYGIVENRGAGKWTCDMCVNDKNPQVSTNYECVLCPVVHTEHELVEQPKLTHHKKKMSEKDRERERLEVQQARKALELYRKKQEELNRPLSPREALKRTADNNWVHVTCAVFTAEVKFGNAKALEPAEGIPSIPRSKYDEVCRGCNENGGACVTCPVCRGPFHVECARKQGHQLCFDVVPTKASRKDQALTVTIGGVSGIMAPLILCQDDKAFRVHMHDEDGTGLTALQLYVQNYKQADLALTGTVRKANLMTMAAKMSGTAIQAGLRRLSTTNNALSSGAMAHSRNGDSADAAPNALHPGDKVCIRCGIDVSPRWWPIDNNNNNNDGGSAPSPFHTMLGKVGEEAQKFVSQRSFQCHKCHSARMPMKPPSPKPRVFGSSSWSSLEPPRHHLSEPGIAATAAASASILRSPERIPPVIDHRDSRQAPHSWPHPPSIHSVVQSVQPPPHQPHANGSRPHSGPRSFSPASAHSALSPPVQAPPTAAYSDWGPRPRSQHESPPPRQHMNGGPPSLPNGPSLNGLASSLRPPNMPGPPPTGPPRLTHQHGHSHGHQSYMNGMPPSPRRASGPAPPSPYSGSYHPGPVHSAPPLPPPSHGPPHGGHGGPHGLSNGLPPPRHEPYHQSLPPQRQSYPAPHASPPGSRAGLPHDSPPPMGPTMPRNGPDSRPASGASANPSLRNLLS